MIDKFLRMERINSNGFLVRSVFNVKRTDHHINGNDNNSNAQRHIIYYIGRFLLIHFIYVEYKAQYNTCDCLKNLKTSISNILFVFFPILQFEIKNWEIYLQKNRCDHQR